MTVVDSEYLTKPGISSGWIDTHMTVVTSRVDFECGCGQPIRIKGRKSLLSVKDKYNFTITHRNRDMRVVSTNPTETQIFDRMLKVSTYADCRFPRGSKRRYK